jgi:hypothetical protein
MSLFVWSVEDGRMVKFIFDLVLLAQAEDSLDLIHHQASLKEKGRSSVEP